MLIIVLLISIILLSVLSLLLLFLCYRRHARLAKSSSQHQALLTSSTTTVSTVIKSHDTSHQTSRASRASVSRHINPTYRQEVKDTGENTDLMSGEETSQQENIFNQWRDVSASVHLRGIKQETEHSRKGAKTEQKNRMCKGEYSLDISRTERYILEV